jgi:hypothetical protein
LWRLGQEAVSDDATFSGPPTNLEAWQAVNQAIGYLQGREWEVSREERRSLRQLRWGLEKAADVLNHRAGAES